MASACASSTRALTQQERLRRSLFGAARWNSWIAWVARRPFWVPASVAMSHAADHRILGHEYTFGPKPMDRRFCAATGRTWLDRRSQYRKVIDKSLRIQGSIGRRFDCHFGREAAARACQSYCDLAQRLGHAPRQCDFAIPITMDAANRALATPLTLHARQRKQNRCQAFGSQAIDSVALNVGAIRLRRVYEMAGVTSRSEPSSTKKGRTLRPALASLFCSDGRRISNPCRPSHPYRPFRHHPASLVPSSPASPRPSPRWSPADRRPKPHLAAPSAPPWSGQQCRPSPGP
jgi:hypothetical protein